MPTPSYLPFQVAAGGSQTSNLMLESADGFRTPSTRQKAEWIATGPGGSLPATLNGGVIARRRGDRAVAEGLAGEALAGGRSLRAAGEGEGGEGGERD